MALSMAYASEIGTLTMPDAKTVSYSGFASQSDISDDYGWKHYGYCVIASNDGTNWYRLSSKNLSETQADNIHHWDDQTGSGSYTDSKQLIDYGYSYIKVARTVEGDNPNFSGFYFSKEDGSQTSFVQGVTNTIELSTPALDMETVTLDSTTSLTVEAAIDTSVFFGMTLDTVTSLSTTPELVEILILSSSYASATSLVIEAQEVLAVQYFISGNVTLSGTGQPDAKIFAIHGETETVGGVGYTDTNGNYEIGVAETGTYHVFAIYSDDVGNKYTAMLQPYVAVS